MDLTGFAMAATVIGGLVAGAVLVSLLCQLANDLCDRWDRWNAQE